MDNHRYYAIYKPYLTLSQFSREGDKKTLKDFFDLPTDVYPVGRLDNDSEGLLILTNDRQLNQRLLHPSKGHKRMYYVQVDGQITENAIHELQKGVLITVDGKSYQTKSCTVRLMSPDPVVPARNPPIRFRKAIPAPWIAITLREGKNRQVRKMCAAVGFPVLRLIRYSIEKLTIEGFEPGEMRSLTKAALEELLF